MKTFLWAVVLTICLVGAGCWWFFTDHGPRYVDPSQEFSFVIPEGWKVVYGATEEGDKTWNGFLGDPYLIPTAQTLIKPPGGAYIHLATSSDLARSYQLYPGDRFRGNAGPSQAQFDKNWPVSNDPFTSEEKGACNEIKTMVQSQLQVSVDSRKAIEFASRCQADGLGGYYGSSLVWIRIASKAYVVDSWSAEAVEANTAAALDTMLRTWRFGR